MPERKHVRFLVYTTTWGQVSKTYRRTCGGGLSFSVAGDLQTMAKADAVIFHSPDTNSLPVHERRDSSQVWVLRSMESAENDRRIDRTKDNRGLSMFNLSSTYRRDCDGWIPYMPKDVRSLMRPVVPASKRTKSAPIVWFSSNCWTASNREDFVKELSKYVKVDAFGRCGQSTYRDPILGKGGNNSGFKQFLSQYKFYISLENSECGDYITEKYWRALQLGLIPIVWGTSEGIDDFAPTNHSIVKVSDFRTIKELAEFIKKVDADDRLFEEFMSYKDVDLGGGKILRKRPSKVLSAKFLSLYRIPRGECALARSVLSAVSQFREKGIESHVKPDSSCLSKPSWKGMVKQNY